MATNVNMNLNQNLPSVERKGRTGVIVKVESDGTAVLRDNIYSEISFSKNVVKFPVKDNAEFQLKFREGSIVYYDLSDTGGEVKCTRIWLGKNAEEKKLLLKPKAVYVATVIKIRSPYGCIAEEKVSKAKIYICNQGFMPKPNSPKLKKEDPIICYVKTGDIVHVKVRHTPDKEFEWMAQDAWMEDSKNSEDKISDAFQQKNKSVSSLRAIDKNHLIGVVSRVYHKSGYLENNLVVFHRDNAILFGIPLRDIQLHKVFSEGDKVNYILSDQFSYEASCVWLGSQYKASDDVVEMQRRISGLIKYCQEKGIHPEIQKTLLHMDGRQQNTGEVNGISGINMNCSTEKNSILGQRVIRHSETISGTDGVNIKTSVEGKQSFGNEEHSVVAGEIKSYANDVLQPNKTSVEGKQSLGNEEHSDVAGEIKSYANDVLQPNKTSVEGKRSFGNEEHSDVAGEIKSYANYVLQHKEDTSSRPASSGLFSQREDIPDVFRVPKFKIRSIVTEPNEFDKPDIAVAGTEVQLDLHGNLKEEEKTVLREVENSASTNDSREQDSENSDITGSISLEKEDVASTTSQPLGVLLIDKMVAQCLKSTLMRMFKEEFGEDASEFLGRYAMDFFKNELEKYIMQDLMKKTLSSVMEKHSEMYVENSIESDPNSSRNSSPKRKLRKMILNWKKDTKQMLEEERAKQLKKKLNSVLLRAKQFQEKLNSTFDVTKTVDIQYSDDDSSDEFDEDSSSSTSETCNVEEKNRLVSIVQDFMKIQNSDICQVGVQNKNKCTDNGTQTTSTGHVLYFNYLTDV